MRYQEVDFETSCKKLETALRRFEKKYPAVYEIWGEVFKYMYEHGEDYICENGYALHCYTDLEDVFYFCFIATEEYQIIQ